MRKILHRLSLAASLLILSPFSVPFAVRCAAQPAAPRPTPNTQLADRDLNKRVEALLRQMTLEEKIGQTVQYSAGFATGPEGSKVSYDELIQRGAAVALLNVYDAERTNHYQHIAMEKSRLHIPVLFGMDVIHGDRTTFPVPLGLAASWDQKLVAGVARTSAVA